MTAGIFSSAYSYHSDEAVLDSLDLQHSRAVQSIVNRPLALSRRAFTVDIVSGLSGYIVLDTHEKKKLSKMM